MVGFGGLLPGSGLTVRTVLTNPSTRPGLSLPGRLSITAGRSPVTVDRVTLGLVTRVEPAGGEVEYQPVEFHRVPAAGSFVLAPDERRILDFGVPVPWETPVTVVDGQCLLNLRMGLRAEVAVSPLLDRGDLRTVHVHPLPAQAGVLGALGELGFELRQVGLLAERLPGIDQKLPFHQKIAYWAAPLYGGPFSELEVSFFADPSRVEVLFALDRRVALAGAGHLSLSRFRVAHQGAAELDWITVVDNWLRYAVQRHSATAAGYQVRTERRPSPPPRPAGAEGAHRGPSGTNTPDSAPAGGEPHRTAPAAGHDPDPDRGLRQMGGGEGGIGGGAGGAAGGSGGT
ncbi:sporulation protein [Plantactinospora sp. WMMB334]|uniref:sporulation protein n=1 Tax=Plantactinospora sp. WMMB334 TaxID=3404119 RepID=UPI003B935AB8